MDHMLRRVDPDGLQQLQANEDEHEEAKEIQQLALRAKKVLFLEDVCRMDVRMDNAGNPYILEVNPIPLMFPDPKQASLIYAADAIGYSYTDIIRKIVDSARARWHLS